MTGEITLEKLSSQIMVKKTRSEKPDSKLETPIVLPTQSSRPQTPNNVAKHDSSKSSQNKKVTDHKTGNKQISADRNLSFYNYLRNGAIIFIKHSLIFQVA